MIWLLLALVFNLAASGRLPTYAGFTRPAAKNDAAWDGGR